MNKHIIVISLFIFMSSVGFSEQDPFVIPENITDISTGYDKGYDFRLVITRLCSPEHCVSRGRIEWFFSSNSSDPATVEKSIEVEEVGGFNIVSNITYHYSLGDTPPYFKVEISNTYSSDFDSEIIHIYIEGVGKYH